jgi:hypothetical protein
MAMQRKDRDEDIAERRARYQAGYMDLCSAVRGFKELTGIDLLDTVDERGRHMGDPPYLKITPDRLREITEQIEEGFWQSTPDLTVVPEVADDSRKVLQFTARRPSAAKR